MVWLRAVRDYDAAKKTPDYQHFAGPCLGRSEFVF